MGAPVGAPAVVRLLVAVERVSRGRSSGGDRLVCREGPNAEPRRKMFVLVGVAMSAANPVRGLGGKVGG